MERYIPFFSDSNSFIFKEKLYNIQKDVNFIYENSFKELIDDIQNSTLKNKEYYLLSSNGDIAVFDSSQLVTLDCVRSHKVNPINIYCGIYAKSSYSFGKDRELIISINNQILNVFEEHMSLLNTNSKFRRIKNEVTEKRIKASIAHELAHWIDDSIYSIFKKIIGDEKDIGKQQELLSFGTGIMDITYYEIQAQIHGVEQIKNKFTQTEWDELTINDLFELYPALADVIETVNRKENSQIAEIWIKAILKRLHREKLLGKKMLTTLDVKSLLEQCMKSNIIYD